MSVVPNSAASSRLPDCIVLTLDLDLSKSAWQTVSWYQALESLVIIFFIFELNENLNF